MSQTAGTAKMPDRSAERRLMVDGQIRTFDVTDLDVIDRFLAVPRENFVEAGQGALAYSDAPLKLSGSPARTLLAPMILARMIQNAEIRARDRVLDLAGGLGYGAAILSGLATEVVAVESGAARVAQSAAALAALGCGNVRVEDGAVAAGAAGPFDVILLNGGYAANIEPLLALLADGGRMIAIRTLTGGSLGQVTRHESTRGIVGSRPLFDARAPVIEGFAAAPAFAF